MASNKFLKKHGKAIMGIFIIATFLLSSIAYVIESAPQSTSDDKIITTPDYKHYLNYNNYNILVNNYPSVIEDMYNDNIDFDSLDEFYIGYTINETELLSETELNLLKAMRDIQPKLMIMKKTIITGCIDKCSYQNKIDCKTITDKAIIFKQASTNQIYQKDNCYYFESNDLNKTVDYLIYRNANIING